MPKMPAVSPAATELLERLAPADPRFVVKKMFGQKAAFVNGNLFMEAFGADLFVRLGQREAEEAVRLPGFRPFEPMPGRVMTGYVIVPATVLADPKKAKVWVARALAHGAGLPAKQPKR